MAVQRIRVNVRYSPNHREFGKFMRSDQVKVVAVAAAHDIADRAAELASKDTGNYARSFQVNAAARDLAVKGNLRAIAEVYNSDPAAAGQEFGDRWDNPPQRTLGLAGGEVGEWRDPA